MNTAALRLLLQALARRACAVDAHPGLAHPVLGPAQLLVPPGLAAGAAAVARVAGGRKPMALAVLSAVEDARVERLLARDFPGVRRWFAAALPGTAVQGLGFTALMGRLDRALADPAAHDGHHWVQRAQQGFWALPADAAPQSFADLAMRLANMLGQMRVPFDTQYVTGAAYRDDHSYLWDHARTGDAEPLPAGGGAPTASAVGHDGALAAPVLRERHYGEWHERLGRWRTAWCRVQERSVARTGAAPPPRPRSLPPEAEGEALDLQAAVAALADRRRGRSWDARLFRRTVPPVRASVLLLLDLSQSTLATWGAGPLTVQAVQRQVALGLALRLTAQGARVAVHGFASNGRAEVAYWRAVEFGAPCDAAALAALPVRHSTRLGAALRHGQAVLGEQAGPRRSLVLLGDGQPWDIDVFEPGHLLHDARRAVDALRSAGVQARCIAPDGPAAAELQSVFGAAWVHRLCGPASVAQGLQQVCRAILGN